MNEKCHPLYQALAVNTPSPSGDTIRGCLGDSLAAGNFKERAMRKSVPFQLVLSASYLWAEM